MNFDYHKYKKISQKKLKSDINRVSGGSVNNKRSKNWIAWLIIIGIIAFFGLMVKTSSDKRESEKESRKIARETVHRSKPVIAPSEVPDIPEPEPIYMLEVLSWSWSRSSDYYVEVRGEVKNISGRSLKNIDVLVSFYDKNGTFITLGSALIEFNPILPGQKSPFKVLETYNPAMQKATLQFKFLMGGFIPSKAH